MIVADARPRPVREAPWHRSSMVRARHRGADQGTRGGGVISFDEGVGTTCPECGETCGRYDTRTRTWRHLDTMQYRTLLTADVPRVKCSEHGVKQVKVPWAEPGSRFTAMFEALVIDWLHEASTSAVARMLGMSWDEVDGVMSRAVACIFRSTWAAGPTDLGRRTGGSGQRERSDHHRCRGVEVQLLVESPFRWRPDGPWRLST